MGQVKKNKKNSVLDLGCETGLASGYLVLPLGEQNLKEEHPGFQRYRAFELLVIFVWVRSWDREWGAADCIVKDQSRVGYGHLYSRMTRSEAEDDNEVCCSWKQQVSIIIKLKKTVLLIN